MAAKIFPAHSLGTCGSCNNAAAYKCASNFSISRTPKFLMSIYTLGVPREMTDCL